MYVVIFAFAILSFILIPLAPELVRLRIKVLKWLHWTWAVHLLERHFEGWVLFFRCVLFAIGAGLLYIGVEDLFSQP